jgi:hypothetical protein
MRGATEHTNALNPEDRLTAIGRSAYSAYNGGPGAYDRWHDPRDSRHQVDAAFWSKYQTMSAGQSFDIIQCALRRDVTIGH